MTQNNSLTLPIEGMTCASCSARVERALQRVPGVRQASVNLASESDREGRLRGGRAPRPCAAHRWHDLRDLRGRVEKALKAVPGVLGASVNLAASTAQVTRLTALHRRHAARRGAACRLRQASERRPADRGGAAPQPRSDLDWWPLGVAALLRRHWCCRWWATCSAATGCCRRRGSSLLATPVQFWLGARFYKAGWKALRAGSRQHGPAGGAGHQRGLRAEPGAVAAATA
jgi:Cu+-exporting ATPase